jgi:hypothetical protein
MIPPFVLLVPKDFIEPFVNGLRVPARQVPEPMLRIYGIILCASRSATLISQAVKELRVEIPRDDLQTLGDMITKLRATHAVRDRAAEYSAFLLTLEMAVEQEVKKTLIDLIGEIA